MNLYIFSVIVFSLNTFSLWKLIRFDFDLFLFITGVFDAIHDVNEA